MPAAAEGEILVRVHNTVLEAESSLLGAEVEMSHMSCEQAGDAFTRTYAAVETNGITWQHKHNIRTRSCLSSERSVIQNFLVSGEWEMKLAESQKTHKKKQHEPPKITVAGFTKKSRG